MLILYHFLAPENHELTNVQVDLLKQAMTKIKETVTRLATEHRDSHSTVSKVGKAIDRNFVSDFAATSRDDVLTNSEKVELLNRIICQHYHRHGYKDVAEELATVQYTYLYLFYLVMIFITLGSRYQSRI